VARSPILRPSTLEEVPSLLISLRAWLPFGFIEWWRMVVVFEWIRL
jgi:hypothetical protein